MPSLLRALGTLLLALLPLTAHGAGGEITLFSLNDTETGQDFSVKVQILILMTLLGFLPAMLMMMTCFTRFIIALIVTLLVMRPVWQEIHAQAYTPFQHDELTLEQALDSAKGTLSGFMLAQTNQTSLQTMVSLAGEELPEDLAELDFSLLLPAFVLSELKTAFQLGFMIFLPFLVIDLVVASVLMAMGMMMLSPMMISLPFKLMVFVLVDGWALLMGTLTTSVQPF